MNMKKTLLILGTLSILTPIATWAMYKPARVLAPDWISGVVCVSSIICLEDESKLQEAEALYHDAAHFVSSTVGVFKNNPKVVFCTTENCYRSFGFKQASATTVGTSGIVVSPRGWKPYYLRHEMIHHRQSEELGVFRSLLKPEWFIEGMAYSLSHDPRQELSSHWQKTREKFDEWLERVGANHLWEKARNI